MGTEAGWSAQQLRALQGSAGNRAVTAMLRPAPKRSVQRALGVELEDSNWTVTAAPGVKIGKGVPVVDRPQFELQAEFGGEGRTNLEMVTKPPGVDEAAFPQMLQDMAALIAELNARQAGGAFQASDLGGGRAGFTIHPATERFSPFLQVTVGVPLAAVPAFFDALKGNGSPAAQIMSPGADARGNTAAQLQQDLDLEEPPSEKLIGLITLLGHYMLEGRSKSTFPKGSIGALAKTDFAEIFMMLPSREREAIRTHLDRWVEAIAKLGTAADRFISPARAKDPGYDPAKMPVLADAYEDKQTSMGAMSITTSREEWLKTMVSTEDDEGVEHKGRDVLSIKGKLAAPDTPQMAGMGDKEKQALKLGKDVERMWLDEPGISELRGIEEGRIKSSSARQLAMIENVIADLEDLHAGFGALGAKSDTVVYEGEPGRTQASTAHRAVIMEIRRPTGTWETGAMNVFKALNEAIAASASKASGGDAGFHSKLPKPARAAPVPRAAPAVEHAVSQLASVAERDAAELLTK
jgi:hypothetical protein